LIDIAKHEPDLRGMALTALERSATPAFWTICCYGWNRSRSVDTGLPSCPFFKKMHAGEALRSYWRNSTGKKTHRFRRRPCIPSPTLGGSGTGAYSDGRWRLRMRRSGAPRISGYKKSAIQKG